MAEDIREDQMTVSSIIDYLRGLKGKDSVLISLSTLLSMTIKNAGNVGHDDLKNVGTCFGYSYSSNDGSGINGIFLSIEVAGCYFQLKVSHTGYPMNLEYIIMKTVFGHLGNLYLLLNKALEIA